MNLKVCHSAIAVGNGLLSFLNQSYVFDSELFPHLLLEKLSVHLGNWLAEKSYNFLVAVFDCGVYVLRIK